MCVNDKEHVSFKEDEANANDWVEDTIKKINQNDRDVGAELMEETMKEANSVPKKLKLLSMVRSHQKTINDWAHLSQLMAQGLTQTNQESGIQLEQKRML